MSRVAVCILRVVVQAPGLYITVTTNPDIAVVERERSSAVASAEEAVSVVRDFLIAVDIPDEMR